MQSPSNIHFDHAHAKRSGGHRPFGLAGMITTLAALSPVCAVSGMMLAQVLGFVSY